MRVNGPKVFGYLCFGNYEAVLMWRQTGIGHNDRQGWTLDSGVQRNGWFRFDIGFETSVCFLGFSFVSLGAAACTFCVLGLWGRLG
jgi:hypothetical protein